MRIFSGLLGLAALAAISASPASAADLRTSAPAPVAPATTNSGVQLGVLVCEVTPNAGFIIGSVRHLNCELRTNRLEPYTVLGKYTGTVSRFGLDLSAVTGNTLAWGVFAPTRDTSVNALAGRYIGVSANAALVVGGGVNVLLGGSNDTIALQPLSVESVTGASVAAGITELKLDTVAPSKAPRAWK
ncbi:DUF992 domain-containing protein [Xanthobacter sp. TB0136]|uniref:DUF992 domain-containing protein n=1 Tax=Xanthobacter sp. TB0136 TaxID=3459177 RepID=UPI00403A507D